MFGQASEPSLASSTASRRDEPETASDPAAPLRRLTAQITLGALLITAALAAATRIRIDFGSFGSAAESTTALLIGSVVLSRKRVLSRKTDVFGVLLLVWVCGIAGGLISLIGLRLHFPLVDRQLLHLDHLAGIDTVGIVRLLGHLPWNAMIFVRLAYKCTLLVLFVSMIGLSLLGDCVESWRAALCFSGTVVSICVLSILTPAKGVGTWLTIADRSALPHGATQYFWRSFDSFYSGANPCFGWIQSTASFHSLRSTLRWASS